MRSFSIEDAGCGAEAGCNSTSHESFFLRASINGRSCVIAPSSVRKAAASIHRVLRLEMDSILSRGEADRLFSFEAGRDRWPS